MCQENPWKREKVKSANLCRTVTQTETAGWKIASQSVVLCALQTRSVCQASIQASTWWLESPPLTRWYQAWDWYHPHPQQKWPSSKKSSTAKAALFSPKIQVSTREKYLLFPLQWHCVHFQMWDVLHKAFNLWIRRGPQGRVRASVQQLNKHCEASMWALRI